MRSVAPVFLWILSFVVCLSATLQAAERESGVDQSAGDVAFFPGVKIAESASQMTGVAISPLLGMSLMGAWYYFSHAEADRAALPLFCHPFVWGPGLLIIGLCFLKDSFGTGAPALLKKPFDVAELFENKLSALLACGSVLPFLSSELSSVTWATTAAGSAPIGFAAIPANLGGWIWYPLLLGGFLVVWVVSHAIHVLILISPFALVDSVLKGGRTLFLLLLVTVSAISPAVGLLLCLAIIAVSAWLAPACFRMAVFGGVMSADLIRSLLWRSQAPEETAVGFVMKGSGFEMPARSMGRVLVDGDRGIRFESRSWLTGRLRVLNLGDPMDVAIERGLLFPSLSVFDREGKRRTASVALLPRYRPHVEVIQRRFRLGSQQEHSVLRGLRGVWNWFAGFFTKLPADRRTVEIVERERVK